MNIATQANAPQLMEARQESSSGGLLDSEDSLLAPSTHIWRIIMNSRISRRVLGRGLILMSVAILVNANTVLAADRVSDAQTQARDLLSGAVGATRTIDRALATSAVQHQESHPDAQKRARQIILGQPSLDDAVTREFAAQSVTNVPVPARRTGRVHTDPQELARRMILGTEGGRRQSTGMRLGGTREVKT